MYKTKQVGNKRQLMPEGYLLCKDNHEYYWLKEDGTEGYRAWDRWWVRSDAIFHKENGYSYEGSDEDNDKYLKEAHDKLMESITGECIRCGLCCRENWRFAYKICWGKSITPDYRKTKPKGYSSCVSFDIDSNTCKTHRSKIAVCKYWPLLESDLEQINCPGYKLIT